MTITFLGRGIDAILQPTDRQPMPLSAGACTGAPTRLPIHSIAQRRIRCNSLWNYSRKFDGSMVTTCNRQARPPLTAQLPRRLGMDTTIPDGDGQRCALAVDQAWTAA